MTDLWIFGALLLALGVIAVLWPIWRHRRTTTVDRTTLNVALYEERLAELDAQVAAGEITPEQREVTAEEASRLLLEDTARADGRQGVKRRGSPVLLIIAAGLLPLIVTGLYMSWGNPAGLALYRELQESPDPSSLEQMIDRMERVTEVQPENGEAWFMLGRGYMSAQQPDRAIGAFENSLKRIGERPEVLAQLAQARFFAAGNQLDTEAAAALDKALELNPDEPTALGLLGIAAFEAGEYTGAIQYWERLLAGMPPGGPGAQAIQGGIDRARERLGLEPSEANPEQAVADESAVIRVRLELSDEVTAELDESAVIFLFARDPEGPPMPLVARRFTLNELPADVILSSSDAMLPEVTLSEGQTLELIARVSPEGDAMQGSHQETLGGVKVGAEDQVLLRVDTAVQ
ncbi:c-type cytochrome biogenesis protein CcmI [Pseudomonas sp. gcc21]|uniref:c-type cytochrome biogenesis protein CcmI n=1 Tax=Pseudomonas sp. gcc21 TaxID=2726989 RepID=UPI0014525D39|nr:c-type cytochrome biogenesis protein CcmI [Pseudomonas sp. gcc21]QJD58714.1 c-type cytochrome biogenesis protein CcmI [Pseudomonas sp. gcc21]